MANILNKYLGKYIQNLDPDDLKVGILGGKEFTLHHYVDMNRVTRLSSELKIFSNHLLILILIKQK